MGHSPSMKYSSFSSSDASVVRRFGATPGHRLRHRARSQLRSGAHHHRAAGAKGHELATERPPTAPSARHCRRLPSSTAGENIPVRSHWLSWRRGGHFGGRTRRRRQPAALAALKQPAHLCRETLAETSVTFGYPPARALVEALGTARPPVSTHWPPATKSRQQGKLCG